MMSTNIATGLAGPQVDCALNSRLMLLRKRIAAIRVQSDAIRAVAAAPSTGELPMVPVFSPSQKKHDGMNADRDVSKRIENIQKLLHERGALRVLGAIASPALAESITLLRLSHPNFGQAVDYLLGEEILARQRGCGLCGLRLLIHGAAGTGKTDFSLALAKLMGVPAEVLSFSAAQASASLAGSEEYWSNSQPGVVWQQLIRGTHANPLFVLDEVDKAPDHWGDPLGALFQLLEPRTAAIFCDKSIPWLPIDASKVNWIATANDVERLHPAIRSRFFEVEVGPPTEATLSDLVQRLYVDLLDEFGVANRFPPALSAAAVSALIGLSVRDAKRILRAALAEALREGRAEFPIRHDRRGLASHHRIGFI